MAGFALLFITVCMLMQMITEGEVLEDNLWNYFNISAEYKTGGGILGGVLCRFSVIALRVCRHLCDYCGCIDDFSSINYPEIGFRHDTKIYHGSLSGGCQKTGRAERSGKNSEERKRKKQEELEEKRKTPQREVCPGN